MRLFLVRHGETEENKKGILQGHMPGNLSQKGIDDAKKLAQRLKDEKFDHIYCSDLKRAVDTAKEIIRFHPDTPISFVEELRETDLGDFQGRTREQCDWDNKPANIEPWPDAQKRARSFLDSLKEKHISDTILCISHAGLNKCFLSLFLGVPGDKIHESVPIPKNTSVNIFEITPEKQEIVLQNCVKHLE